MITIRKHGRLSKLILAVILLLAASAFGQTRQEYSVSDFRGGLNLATDSIDQAPNEAIQSDNATLDKFGALHKRYGIKNWNDSLISVDSILDIHYVEDKNGDKMLFVATNNYIYERKTWEDTTDWSGSEIDYTLGSLDSIKSSRVYADTGSANPSDDSTKWVLIADVGDKIVVGDSTYTIDTILTDWLLAISGDNGVADTIGDASYRILKQIVGNPQLSSFNGILYVADSDNEPWGYDSAEPFNLGISDSGYASTVTATVELDPYSPDSSVYVYNNIIQAWNYVFSDTFSNGDSVKAAGNYFEFDIFIDPTLHHFTSEIISVSSDTIRLTISKNVQSPDSYDPPLITPLYPFAIANIDTSTHRWRIISPKSRGSSDNQASIKDSTKTWRDGEWIGYYLVNGDSAPNRSYIQNNNENTLWIDSLVSVSVNDRYYIAWQTVAVDSLTPVPDHPSRRDVYETQIHFSQIIFHRNRLYAIGHEITKKNRSYMGQIFTNYGDTINTGRVWFSELAIPTSIPPDFNFDISAAKRTAASVSVFSQDASQSLFKLRDDLNVATKSSIYRVSGEPDPGPENLYISQVIQGVGTNQPNGVVTTKDNVAYIMNQRGIWLFDGNVINKISYNIDPLVELYRASRMVAGQFKDNLFFSFPDSNKTLVFFDPLKKFVGPWDIGMLTINNQSVAIDSNYFLFAQAEDSAYVLKYPRDFVNFSDILEPNDTSVVVFRYRPGWLTFGTLRDKVIEDIEITAFTINPVSGYDFLNYLAVYRDFTDTVRWSATGFSEGTPINAFESIGDDGAIHGRAYQILVKDSTDNDFWLSNYLLRWYDPTR